MAAAAQDHVRKHFSAGRMIEQYEHLYATVAS